MIRAALVALGLAVTLSGCTTALGVQPQYVVAGVAAPVYQSHATVVMDEHDRAAIFAGHPESFTGGGTSITVPIGAVISSVGEKVCTAYFAGGASVNGTPKPGDYNVTVVPGTVSYKYDQLSSLGFAVTPKVSVSMSISIKDPNGAVVVPEANYRRTDYSATGAYMISMHPPELINQSLHVAIADIFREALDKIPRKTDAVASK